MHKLYKKNKKIQEEKKEADKDKDHDKEKKEDKRDKKHDKEHDKKRDKGGSAGGGEGGGSGDKHHDKKRKMEESGAHSPSKKPYNGWGPRLVVHASGLPLDGTCFFLFFILVDSGRSRIIWIT